MAFETLLKVDPEKAVLIGAKAAEMRRFKLVGLSVMATAAAPAALSLVLKTPLLLYVAPLLLALGAVLYFYPELEYRSKIGAAESELVALAGFGLIHASVGRDLLLALSSIEDKDVAPNLRRLVAGIKRLRSARLIPSEHEAVALVASKLEGTPLGGILMSFATARTVGIGQYLLAREIYKSALGQLKERYQRLSENAKLLSEVMLVMFGVLPMMLYITASLMYRPETSIIMTAYTFLAAPLMAAALVFMADSMYPKAPEDYRSLYVKMAIGAAAGAAAGAATYALAKALPLVREFQGALFNLTEPRAAALAVAVAAIAASLYPAAYYIARARRDWALVSALPYLMRDVAELVKLGVAPFNALIKLSEKRYNSHMNRVLRRMAKLVTSGEVRLTAAVDPTYPWTFRLAVSMLEEGQRVGARAELYEELAIISRELVDVVRSAKQALRGAIAFAFITVGIVSALLATVVPQLLFQIAAYSTSIPTGSSLPIGFALIKPADVATVLTNAMLGAVFTAVAIGLITGKISSGTLAAAPIYIAPAASIAAGALALL